MDRRDFLLALASLSTAKSYAGEPVAYGRVVADRALNFPADYGAHPEFRTEWWYATGWLNLPDGNPLGFQSTFFRVRTGIGENNPSAFAPRQLLLAHAAIADPGFRRLRHAERSSRVGLGRAGFSTSHTNVWVGDWLFTQRPDGYHVAVNSTDFSYALNLLTNDPPVLNGRAGFSAKAPDPRHASYYYSRPHLKVDGRISVAGKSSIVSGQAWLDHEWSSELLPDGAQGWDWVGINLGDGSSLMAFRLRGTDNPALWSAATRWAASQEPLTFPPAAVEFEATRHWRSPRTAINYPVEWRLRIGQRSFMLQVLMDDQELDSRRSTGAIYWEGAVRLFESDREIGRGYLEMTGYGDKIRVN